MRTIQQWLDAYSESHQNPTNKMIHWFCIPPIMVTVIAFLSLIPHPFANVSPLLHWGSLFIAAAFCYYAILSIRLAVGMVFVGSAMVLCVYALSMLPIPLWASSLGIFVAAWIGQFYGHKIEGKKPSFFEDLQFLLIGPLWLLAAIYRRVGLAY